MLKGKKVIIIGDKDGIPAPTIGACLKTVGVEVVFSVTTCFTCSLAGAMDIENQQRIKDLASQYGEGNLAVILGGGDVETCSITAETISAGDITEVGPLAGVSLGIPVYHIFEPEIRNECDLRVYEERCAIMEMVLDVDKIVNEVRHIRLQYAQI
ncbi:MAG: glycine/sarcosine/betaine reductase complex selenoprotein A [Clostridiaceae bacterium]|nr:glycine/sarcosine/betaine reductase complex selenoprotein A [Clostridiaceae bacterium]